MITLFNISLSSILVNFSYIVTSLGLLIVNILWLRISLVIEEIIMIGYGFITKEYSIIFWNLLFLIINIVQIYKILLQRRDIQLAPELNKIYQKTFTSISKQDFLFFYNKAKHIKFNRNIIMRDGEKNYNLMLITTGQARIIKDYKVLTQLEAGDFIGELSYLSHKPVSADVVAYDKVSVLLWDKPILDTLEKKHSFLIEKLKIILALYLTNQLRKRGI